MDYSRYVKLINNSSMNETNKELAIKFLDYKASRQGVKSVNTIKYNTSYLLNIDEWYNHKPWTEITNDDYNKLVNNLKQHKPLRKAILSYKEGSKLKESKTHFSEGGISNCFKIHKALLKWLWRYDLQGKNQSSNFDKQFPEGYYYEQEEEHEEEPVIFTKEEFEQVTDKLTKKFEAAKKSNNPKKNNYLVALGFFALGWDSGLRPQELWHLKQKHVVWNEEKGVHFVYCQFPKKKSHKRNIDMPYCTDPLKIYLSEIEQEPEAPLFEMKHNRKEYVINYTTRAVLKELKINKHFNAYALRHSSIQHYVELYKGNHVHLAARYGWGLNTVFERLKGYLARSQVNVPDAEVLRREDETKRLKEQLIKEKDAELNKVRREMEDTRTTVEVLKTAILEGLDSETALRLKKKFEEVESNGY